MTDVSLEEYAQLLLAEAPGLGRIVGRLAADAANADRDPLAAEVGIFGVVERLRAH